MKLKNPVVGSALFGCGPRLLADGEAVQFAQNSCSNVRGINPISSMNRRIELLTAVTTAVLLFVFAGSLSAQESASELSIGVPESTQANTLHVSPAQGKLIIPKSSLPQTPAPGQKLAAHTNIQVFIPASVTPEELPPFPGLGYETPASLACVYALAKAVAGCNPNDPTLANPTGGSRTIAIVDAYDDPEAASDLAYFSDQFGLPFTVSQFQVVGAITHNSSCYSGTVPVDFTGGWEAEESLDIEWAHAMAPGATIYLVEACSANLSDLQQAVLVANNLVQCGQTEINPSTGILGTCPAGSNGKGEVSMSWGVSEFAGENATKCTFNPMIPSGGLADGCFTTPNVVYFAASGDGPGVGWPSTSPNVVSAGGLTNRRNPTTFNFIQQTGWVGAGGGQSAIESQPSYQSSHASVQAVCGKVWRCTPDLAFDADPFTGVYIYDTFPFEGAFGLFGYFNWLIIGGTSVSAPSLAGIVNSAGGFAASSKAELTTIYGNMNNGADFFDITSAYCGPYMGFSAGPSYDFCSGVGADKGHSGK
jgi:kumamolisin